MPNDSGKPHCRRSAKLPRLARRSSPHELPRCDVHPDAAIPWYSDTLNNTAYLYCYGADFLGGTGLDFSSLYSTDRFFFHSSYAADPSLNYTQWANLKRRRDIFIPLSTCKVTRQRKSSSR